MISTRFGAAVPFATQTAQIPSHFSPQNGAARSPRRVKSGRNRSDTILSFKSGKRRCGLPYFYFCLINNLPYCGVCPQYI